MKINISTSLLQVGEGGDIQRLERPCPKFLCFLAMSNHTYYHCTSMNKNTSVSHHSNYVTCVKF